jgi:hypothetical protein
MTAVLNETELKYCADNIELCCTVDLCYDVIIVCTGNASQEKYWQKRLEKGLGVFSPKSSIVLAVHEDWVGGAGNGLGTLYAYKKACIAANARDIDLPKMLKDGASVALSIIKKRVYNNFFCNKKTSFYSSTKSAKKTIQCRTPLLTFNTPCADLPK